MARVSVNEVIVRLFGSLQRNCETFSISSETNDDTRLGRQFPDPPPLCSSVERVTKFRNDLWTSLIPPSPLHCPFLLPSPMRWTASSVQLCVGGCQSGAVRGYFLEREIDGWTLVFWTPRSPHLSLILPSSAAPFFYRLDV